MRYKIISIKHAGRHGIRGTDVDDPKYDGLINSIIEMPNLDDSSIKYKSLHFDMIKTDSAYDWFHTSVVLALYLNKNMNYVVETVNTLYEFEKLNEQ